MYHSLWTGVWFLSLSTPLLLVLGLLSGFRQSTTVCQTVKSLTGSKEARINSILFENFIHCILATYTARHTHIHHHPTTHHPSYTLPPLFLLLHKNISPLTSDPLFLWQSATATSSQLGMGHREHPVVAYSVTLCEDMSLRLA